jgi:plasmid stabilization system protein ParE
MAIKYRIIYLPIFNRDIQRIAEALKDYPQKAKRLFHDIDRKLLMLEDFPYMCAVYHANPKYRQMVLDDHLLFYFVDEDALLVKVYRILYEKINNQEYL